MQMKPTWMTPQQALVLVLVFILSWQTDYRKESQPFSAMSKDLITLITMVVKCLIWLLCASAAPFFYWPEFERFKKEKEKEQSLEGSIVIEHMLSKRRRRKVPKYKEKSTNMTGVQKRRMKSEMDKYNRLKAKVTRNWQDVRDKSKRLQFKYVVKKQRDGSRVTTQRELIAESAHQIRLLQRQLILLENTVTAAQSRLKYSRLQNKTLISQYEKIYSQTLQTVC